MSLNIKGQLKQAQLENLSTDPSNLPHGRTWYDTTLNKVKASIAGVAKIIPTVDSTDALTNKTINADLNTITNIENADIKAGAAIDATKIADGSVNNTEFQHISTLTSNAQTQLNSKINSSAGVVSDFLSMTDQGSDPATPSAGFKSLYAKAAGLFYRNSAGTIFQIQTAASTPVTVQRFTSGSGTYTTSAGVRWIRVKVVGGGGGGGGSATAAAGNGGTGSTGVTSTFGTSLLTAAGGVGGSGGNGGSGGSGGTVTINAPAVTIVGLSGGSGTAAHSLSTSGFFWTGGPGASSPFGGQGGGGALATAGTNAIANSGSGGGGAGSPSAGTGGCGGGAAGYVEAVINNPSATYAYTVGSGGGGGTAGTGGFIGGNGGSGVVIVEEFYS